MSAARWTRLADTLSAAGIHPRVHDRRYPGGTSRSMSIPTPSELVEIHDRWWRKNADVWIGWAVHTEGRHDSLVHRSWPLTKKRSEVLAAIQDALSGSDTR